MFGAFCNSFAWLVLIGAVMGALEWLRPANPAQRFLRSGFVTDLIYWLTPYFLYGPLAPKSLGAGAAWVATALTGSSVIGFAAIGRQPLWAQAAEAFVVADFLSYWGHRWLHSGSLWPFHAIHHGVEEMDWLSTIRNHPVNVVVQRLVFTAPVGQGCHSNFGEALAIWDVLFGTLYLPEGAPQRLGLDRGPPADFVGQTLWPIQYFLAPAETSANTALAD
jgi:sterol desaturase/sphingolipid hydroxylase (fatty acid hydroxylase superfamily)